jgi:hypothetical protein
MIEIGKVAVDRRDDAMLVGSAASYRLPLSWRPLLPNSADPGRVLKAALVFWV